MGFCSGTGTFFTGSRTEIEKTRKRNTGTGTFTIIPVPVDPWARERSLSLVLVASIRFFLWNLSKKISIRFDFVPMIDISIPSRWSIFRFDSVSARWPIFSIRFGSHWVNWTFPGLEYTQRRQNGYAVAFGINALATQWNLWPSSRFRSMTDSIRFRPIIDSFDWISARWSIF